MAENTACRLRRPHAIRRSSATGRSVGTLATALERCHPSSVAVLGVGGGNGLDQIDGKVTKRVVGLDLNPHYLTEARKRYSGAYNLILHCVDLAEERVETEPVDLVHAALVFEHAGIDRCLENAVSLVDASGTLCAVLQLPGKTEHEIGVSDFSSMHTLKGNFALVDPMRLRKKLGDVGFRMVHDCVRLVPAGKRLWMGVFERS